jgi:hypothetical protein
MPELEEIKGKLDVDGLVCCLTLNKALQELEQYRAEGDEIGATVLQAMIDGLISALEPIEE